MWATLSFWPMAQLIYVADPMCSWCWGFQSTMEQVHRVVGDTPVQYVMGGLARDSDEPMPEEVQKYVQDQWRKVSATSGAEFNWKFWEQCRPRRSTYPACRAVLAAGHQARLRAMFEAIQRAYYLEVRNPSDIATLSDVAEEIGLDRDRFGVDVASTDVENELQEGFDVRRSMNANAFPSLIYKTDAERFVWLTKGYADVDLVLQRLKESIEIAV